MHWTPAGPGDLMLQKDKPGGGIPGRGGLQAAAHTPPLVQRCPYEHHHSE